MQMNMGRIGRAGVVMVCALASGWAWGAPVAPPAIVGFGAAGDSLGDEYLFTGKGVAQNYVEIGVRYRQLPFGSFSLADRGDVRKQGYEYNWANAGLDK